MRIATAPASSMIPPKTSKYRSKIIFLSPFCLLVGHCTLKNPGEHLRKFAVNLHHNSYAHQVEQLLQVRRPHADTSVGSGLPDGFRSVGSMNSVASRAEAHPASAERISFSRRNHFAHRVPG